MNRTSKPSRDLHTFGWSARSAQGAEAKGHIQAENAELAQALLRRQGLPRVDVP